MTVIESLQIETMHSISQILLWPVIILLIIFFIYSIFSIGILVAEHFNRRKEGIESENSKRIIRDLKISVDNKSDSVDIINSIRIIINRSNLPFYSKKALLEITENEDLDFETRKSIGRGIVEDEELRLFKKLEKTEILAKVSPALGLMGTLIPLGPGLLALGAGDTQTLADSLIIAFDTTVLAMTVASLTYVVSRIRKRWYMSDIETLDNLTEFTLECLK
jgi:biopolymer transport protein ExbB/TolQ